MNLLRKTQPHTSLVSLLTSQLGQPYCGSPEKQSLWPWLSLHNLFWEVIPQAQNWGTGNWNRKGQKANPGLCYWGETGEAHSCRDHLRNCVECSLVSSRRTVCYQLLSLLVKDPCIEYSLPCPSSLFIDLHSWGASTAALTVMQRNSGQNARGPWYNWGEELSAYTCVQPAATARLELKRKWRGYETGHKRCSQTEGNKLNSTAGGKSTMGIRRVYEALRMDFSVKM